MKLSDYLTSLFHECLYNNVIDLMQIFLPCLSSDGNVFLSSSEVYTATMILADSYYMTKDYIASKVWYNWAAQLSEKGKDCQKGTLHSTARLDAKYMMHLCLCEERKYEDAVKTLESIAIKDRSVKVEMAIAELLERTGLYSSAITFYEQVVSSPFLAVRAAVKLLQLGVSGSEVSTLILQNKPKLGSSNIWPCILDWIKIHSQFFSNSYVSCEDSIRNIAKHSFLYENPYLLIVLGKTCYHRGNFENAILLLSRVRSANPSLPYGMDILADIYYKGGLKNKLEDLASSVDCVSMNVHHEPWIVLAYEAMLLEKYDRAFSYSQKALQLSPRNIESLTVNALILVKLKRFDEAVQLFRQALSFCSKHYEPICGLVNCYLSLNRWKDAATLSHAAIKHLNNSVRSLTLCASVMAREPLCLARARSLLEQALKADLNYVPAILLLAQVYEKSNLTSSAVKLLQERCLNCANACIYILLADLLKKGGSTKQAVEYYVQALSLEPQNKTALRGLHSIHFSANQTDFGRSDLSGVNPNTGSVQDAEMTRGIFPSWNSPDDGFS